MRTMFKVGEQHPDACSFAGCGHLVVEGTDKCPRHGGFHIVKRQQATEIKNYRLEKWKSRVAEFATNPSIKSIREEIGIARLLLESILNKCDDETDLIMYGPQISSLVGQINGLVSSCHRMEESLGTLLDESAAIRLAEAFLSIIGANVKDTHVLEQIAQEFEAAIFDVTQESKNEALSIGTGI